MNKFKIHPCFTNSHNGKKLGRIHIPIAPKCFLGCSYCGYKFDSNINNRDNPGVSPVIVSGKGNIKNYLENAFVHYPDIDIVGIAGPGDPLSNPKELEFFFQVMRSHFPKKNICLCTSGYQFEKVEQLIKAQSKLKHITFTINTFN